MNPVGDFPPIIGLRDRRVVVFDPDELGATQMAVDRYWEDLNDERNVAGPRERESILSIQHALERVQEKLA